MESTNKTLDETLKDIVEETAEETKAEDTKKATEDKPKRGRRSKSQSEENKNSKEPAETSEAESKPEVVPDTEKDVAPDVIEEILEEKSSDEPEQLQPEVVPDTEKDAEPDIEDPKPVKKVEKKDPKLTKEGAEAADALAKKNAAPDPNSLVGKQFILKNPTRMYRAPHPVHQIKSYIGMVTVVEDSKDGVFIKVQFLRQGFGLCEGYMLITALPTEDGDNNEEVLS